MGRLLFVAIVVAMVFGGWALGSQAHKERILTCTKYAEQYSRLDIERQIWFEMHCVKSLAESEADGDED